MRVWAFAAWPALLLAGCGNAAEDFADAIKRPVAAVYVPLLAVDVGEARIVFPGVTFVRTRPSDGEILYTIPGDGSFPATIRLRLESQKGDETTVVPAIVNVPQVHARIDGQAKVLSEARIERQLESLLKSTGRSLEMGSSAQAGTMRLSGLLLALAVATNQNQLARAMDLKSNPSMLMELLLAFDGPNEDPVSDVAGREIRTVNPDAAENARELAQTDAEWKQEEALNKAAAPTSNLDRYDN